MCSMCSKCVPNAFNVFQVCSKCVSCVPDVLRMCLDTKRGAPKQALASHPLQVSRGLVWGFQTSAGEGGQGASVVESALLLGVLGSAGRAPRLF